jgi:hypothetical protein
MDKLFESKDTKINVVAGCTAIAYLFLTYRGYCVSQQAKENVK